MQNTLNRYCILHVVAGDNHNNDIKCTYRLLIYRNFSYSTSHDSSTGELTTLKVTYSNCAIKQQQNNIVGKQWYANNVAREYKFNFGNQDKPAHYAVIVATALPLKRVRDGSSWEN